MGNLRQRHALRLSSVFQAFSRDAKLKFDFHSHAGQLQKQTITAVQVNKNRFSIGGLEHHAIFAKGSLMML